MLYFYKMYKKGLRRCAGWYSCIECEVDGVKDSAGLGGCLNRNQYDIFFMDLDMKEDCWEAIETIRYIDCNCALILAAEGAEDAVKGYRTGAVDYLLKPLLKANVMDSLGNALKKMALQEQDNRAVKVRINGIWTTIALDSIAYIESAGHILLFYMTDSTIHVTVSCSILIFPNKEECPQVFDM